MKSPLSHLLGSTARELKKMARSVSQCAGVVVTVCSISGKQGLLKPKAPKSLPRFSHRTGTTQYT